MGVNHKCMGPFIDTPDFPANPEQCTGGIRAEVSFPSCWDGINLDSQPHHNSHVAYRVGGHWEGGPCPDSHPYMMPTVFVEAHYHTQDIYQPGDQLTYSQVDYVGHGFHADFLNGWQPGIMDQLIEYCTYTANQENFCNADNIAGRYGGPGPRVCGMERAAETLMESTTAFHLVVLAAVGILPQPITQLPNNPFMLHLKQSISNNKIRVKLLNGKK